MILYGRTVGNVEPVFVSGSVLLSGFLCNTRLLYKYHKCFDPFAIRSIDVNRLKSCSEHLPTKEFFFVCAKSSWAQGRRRKA